MGMTVNAMAGMQAASETVSDYSVTAKAAETSEKKASAETEKDAVYEKSAQESAKAPYSINKMSKEDRRSKSWQKKTVTRNCFICADRSVQSMMCWRGMLPCMIRKKAM